MAKLIMPKQSADFDEMKAVLKVYYDHGDWLENSEFIQSMKSLIGDQLEPQAYTKKSQIPAYYGFIIWEDLTKANSRRKITDLGREFYEALLNKNEQEKFDALMRSLEVNTFGRNVCGCSSDSDIEPPILFLKSSVILSGLDRKEFGYILHNLEDGRRSIENVFFEIKQKRHDNDRSFDHPNKYNDAKPITALFNWNVLIEERIEGQNVLSVNPDFLRGRFSRVEKLNVYNSVPKNEEMYSDDIVEDDENNGEDADNSYGKNIIYYGAPGTGKSHKVDGLIKKSTTFRTTFHPDSDYNSFIGGYRPVNKDGDISYEFVPQIFMKSYVEAWNNDGVPYFLVIEEINRGNCAEIFGDIFQLLDRDADYDVIPASEIIAYLNEALTNEDAPKDRLIMPKNLTIMATMNTSDQSLFPMDSAFKRRWDWEYVPIDYSVDDKNTSKDFLINIEDGTNYSWLDFIKKVNTLIKLNMNLGMDKCVGNYFINPSDGKNISIDEFIHKIIFYLWNDVFKDEEGASTIFSENTTYEDFFPINSNGKDKVVSMLNKLDVSLVN